MAGIQFGAPCDEVEFWLEAEASFSRCWPFLSALPQGTTSCAAPTAVDTRASRRSTSRARVCPCSRLLSCLDTLDTVSLRAGLGTLLKRALTKRHRPQTVAAARSLFVWYRAACSPRGRRKGCLLKPKPLFSLSQAARTLVPRKCERTASPPAGELASGEARCEATRKAAIYYATITVSSYYTI